MQAAKEGERLRAILAMFSLDICTTVSFLTTVLEFSRDSREQQARHFPEKPFQI